MEKTGLIKLGVISLGCPKNTADTESLLASLAEPVELMNIEDSEIVLLNTCAFLKTARDEVFENLNKLKDKKVILLGCLAGQLKEEIFKEYPQLYAVVSGVYYPSIFEIVESVHQGAKIFAIAKEPSEYTLMIGKHLITPPAYAYIKIAEGCENNCSFCLIPKLKGKYRSRPMEDILDEAKDLVKLGVKELVLVAQDCGLYGFDLYGKKKLAELLKKISDIKGDFWVRVLYVYSERIDDELIRVFADSKKICKYFDIPLQHGDPGILKEMRRPFDIERTLEKISNIRRQIPDVTFRTSLIVGFPGETEEAFKNLKDFVRKIDFDHVGVFEYSREKGTSAYHLDNQVSDGIKKKRREEIMLMQQEIALKKNVSAIGKTHKVLLDRFDPAKKLYIGRTQRNAPDVDGSFIIKSEKPLKLYDFISAKAEKAEPYDVYGKALS